MGKRHTEHGLQLLRAFNEYARISIPSQRVLCQRLVVSDQNYSRALCSGIVTVDRVVDWIAKWNETGGPELSVAWDPDDGWHVWRND
jgi:hypothetical protein